jgi:O-antigen ligase
VWTFAGYEYALQSSSQILCPIIAGIAASTYSFSEARARVLELWIRRSYYICAVGIALIVIPFSLADIENSGWAGGAITLLIFQAWFLASYFLNGRKTLDLILYFSAVAVPVIGANRGPMLAGFALGVCAIIPIPLSRRLLLGGAAAAIGLAAFYTPKVQNKMFFSGQGTIQDLRASNPDLRDNGRTPLWSALEFGMADSPLFGHGGNADRTYLLERGFSNYLPHNDWLRIRFNYGLVGVYLYAGTMLAQVLHALRKLKFAGSPPLTALTAAALTCFVPYVVVMYTDNVLIYCQYFTVPMMLLLGAAYSAKRARGIAVRHNLRPFGRPVSAFSLAK